MECRVYLSTFDHAETPTVVQAVKQAPWQDREQVQLFIKEQEQEQFSACYSGCIENQQLSVSFTRQELEIINNALNEVCNGISLQGEFHTRMGCTFEEARSLLARVHDLALK